MHVKPVERCPQCENALKPRHHEMGSCPRCRLPLTLVAGKYRFQRLIDEGNMGHIYLAHHIHLANEPERVIKVMKPKVLSRPGMSERFMREVRLTAALSRRNEHVVQIYDDFGEEPKLGYYYVMEYLRGQSLKKLLRPGEALSRELIFHIFRQLCQSIRAAHNEGVVHRDLKPENIFLVRRGEDPFFVKVLDFGIAKPLKRAIHTDLTQGAIGTPDYMAPEQCLNVEVDSRCDIYAMGVILYELFTGSTPFAYLGKDALLTMHAQVSELPESMLFRRPELNIPPEVDRIVLRALEKNPADRFASVEDFWRALDEYYPSELDVQQLVQHEEQSGTIDFHALSIEQSASELTAGTHQSATDEQAHQTPTSQEEEPLAEPPAVTFGEFQESGKFETFSVSSPRTPAQAFGGLGVAPHGVPPATMGDGDTQQIPILVAESTQQAGFDITQQVDADRTIKRDISQYKDVLARPKTPAPSSAFAGPGEHTLLDSQELDLPGEEMFETVSSQVGEADTALSRSPRRKSVHKPATQAYGRGFKPNTFAEPQLATQHDAEEYQDTSISMHTLPREAETQRPHAKQQTPPSFEESMLQVLGAPSKQTLGPAHSTGFEQPRPGTIDLTEDDMVNFLEEVADRHGSDEIAPLTADDLLEVVEEDNEDDQRSIPTKLTASPKRNALPDQTPPDEIAPMTLLDGDIDEPPPVSIPAELAKEKEDPLTALENEHGDGESSFIRQANEMLAMYEEAQVTGREPRMSSAQSAEDAGALLPDIDEEEEKETALFPLGQRDTPTPGQLKPQHMRGQADHRGASTMTPQAGDVQESGPQRKRRSPFLVSFYIGLFCTVIFAVGWTYWQSRGTPQVQSKSIPPPPELRKTNWEIDKKVGSLPVRNIPDTQPTPRRLKVPVQDAASPPEPDRLTPPESARTVPPRTRVAVAASGLEQQCKVFRLKRKLRSAIECYHKLLNQPNAPDDVRLVLGQLYFRKGRCRSPARRRRGLCRRSRGQLRKFLKRSPSGAPATKARWLIRQSLRGYRSRRRTPPRRPVVREPVVRKVPKRTPPEKRKKTDISGLKNLLMGP